MELKFKVGDKLRVKKGVTQYGYTNQGSEGVVIKAWVDRERANRYSIEYYKLSGGITCTSPARFSDCRESQLELIGRAGRIARRYHASKS